MTRRPRRLVMPIVAGLLGFSSFAVAQEGDAPNAPPAPPPQAPAGESAPPQGRVQTTQTVPFGVPAPGTDVDDHLGSSSQAKGDINQGDDFDLGGGQEAAPTVRGNPNAPGILGSDLRGNTGLYVVRPGDTLSSISQDVYGQPWMWPKLWSLNPQIQNPHWIYPGDQVRLTSAAGGRGKPLSVKTLGTGVSDRRPEVPEDTVFLRHTGYIDDPAKGISGEVVGAKKPIQLMAEGDTVYLAIKPGSRLTRGQRLTIFRPVREPPSVEGARQPPGMIVAIQGTVEVDYVDQKSRVARGVIVESVDVIERGAKVGDVGRRFDVVPPRKAGEDVTARILTSMHPHEVMGEHQIVFIDRGERDGLQPGHRLFVIRRGDTWRRTLSTAGIDARTRINMDAEERVELEGVPLHGDEQKFPEEVVGELRVVRAHAFSAYAVITDSRVALVPGDRAIARRGF